MLGQLFRSEAFQRNETELVIIVTPYIVHPIATASRAMTPVDGYLPPSDGAFVTHAPTNTSTQPPAARRPTSGSPNLIGPVGFDLE